MAASPGGTPAPAVETLPPQPAAHTPEPGSDSRAGRLSFYTKVCYGIGGVPNQVASSATAFYLQLFLLDVAQIPAAQVSLVLFGGKVSGAAADPVAGFFINRSRRTGFGRLMPWVLGCTPFIALAYLFLWFLPPFTSLRGIWYITFYCLFQALSTFFQVPYTALTMLLTPSPRERDSATAYRMTMEMAGTLMGAAVHGLIVSGAHARNRCEDAALLGPVAISPDATRLYSIAAAVVAVTYPVCSSVLHLGVKEQPGTRVQAVWEAEAGGQAPLGYEFWSETWPSRDVTFLCCRTLCPSLHPEPGLPGWAGPHCPAPTLSEAGDLLPVHLSSSSGGAELPGLVLYTRLPATRPCPEPGANHPGLCYTEHPAVGVVSAAIWEEDVSLRDLCDDAFCNPVGCCAHSPCGICRVLCIWREHCCLLAATLSLKAGACQGDKRGSSAALSPGPCFQMWWMTSSCSTSTAQAWRPSFTHPTSSSPRLQAQAPWASPHSVWSLLGMKQEPASRQSRWW
nr:PREDICTED: major facilitator superfamily domain-containing protein 2B isoform X3 [Rhinolophus sinicus]